MSNEGMQSVNRIFQVIEKIAESQTKIGITEISRVTGLPKSTVFRTVNALVDSNYLIKDEFDKYGIGYKFIAIAKNYTSKLDLREIAGPYLVQLVQSYNVTAHIAVRREDKAVYIEKIQPHSYVCMYSEIGKSIELYCSSLGKSLMLGMSDEQFKDYIDRENFVKYTKNTLDKNQLIEQMQEVRKTNLAFDYAEHEEGVYCMSVPIIDYSQKIIGAISISSANAQLLKNSLAIEHIKKCGVEISRQFGK